MATIEDRIEIEELAGKIEEAARQATHLLEEVDNDTDKLYGLLNADDVVSSEFEEALNDNLSHALAFGATDLVDNYLWLANSMRQLKKIIAQKI